MSKSNESEGSVIAAELRRLRHQVRNQRRALGVLIAWSAGIALYAFLSDRENQRMICHASDYDELLGQPCERFFSGDMLGYALALGIGSLLFLGLAVFFLNREPARELPPEFIER